MSLCAGVIDIIESEAARQGFARVTAIRLEIGALSHVDPEAMAFAFDAALPGTIAEGARLDIERPPGVAWCMDCEAPTALSARYDPCPNCGGHKLHVTGGDEMRIKDLEVV